jgi:hypothetical protein
VAKTLVTLKVEPEFLNLIPKLRDEEYEALEASIIAEGCRDPLVLWGETIVDGHNRYTICHEHNIPFSTVQREFEDKDDAKVWIIRHQLGRRNLIASHRAGLAEKLRGLLEKKGREGMSIGGRGGYSKAPQDLVEVPENPSERETNAQIGKMANLSRETIRRRNKVKEEAPDIFGLVDSGEISINKGYDLWKERESEDGKGGERRSIIEVYAEAAPEQPPDAYEIKGINRLSRVEYSVTFGDGKKGAVTRRALEE